MEDCICTSAAQPVAEMDEAPASSPPVTQCTGYIDGRGRIAHQIECALHRFKPGAWQCSQTSTWSGGEEPCEGTGFYAQFVDVEVRVTISEGHQYVYSGFDGGIEAEGFEDSSYGYDDPLETIADNLPDPQSFMCAECEYEWVQGDPEYNECLELWRKANSES